ncbi:MAG: porin [Paracoccaceae bacterium]
MKKVLLSTSALALVGAVATPAAAAEWEVDVGGFSTQLVYFGSADVDGVDTDYDGVDVLSNTEIRFRPSITLDNGLKIGADIQLEGNTSSDTIDESFVSIDGSFGRIQIGSENSAGYTMTFTAPDESLLPINSGSVSVFVPLTTGAPVETLDDAFRGPLGSSFVENNRNNDAQRITYFSPRFAGLQVGASYARDDQQDSSEAVDLNGEIGNYFDVGVNYVNSFGGVDVAVSGRWGIATNDAPNSDNPQVYAIGANVGFAGVTVGGTFAEQNNAGNNDATGYSAGIAYNTGPWGVSFSYYSGEGVNDQVFDSDLNQCEVLGCDETYEAFSLGVSYALAKGVQLGAFGIYVDGEEETGDAGGAGDDFDGFAIGTGIAISF